MANELVLKNISKNYGGVQALKDRQRRGRGYMGHCFCRGRVYADLRAGRGVYPGRMFIPWGILEKKEINQ